MLKIEAIVPSFRLDEVKSALRTLNCGQFMMSEVAVGGGSHPATSQYRGCAYEVDVRRLKLEMYVQAHSVDDVIEVLSQSACTPFDGDDGVIVVSDILNIVRIHSGHRTGLGLQVRNRSVVDSCEEPLPAGVIP